MSLAELVALTPILVVAAISILIMLFVTFMRHHRLVSLLTSSGFICAAMLFVLQIGGDTIQITPLIIMDDYSRFFAALVCFASVPAVFFAYDYLEYSEDLKEEYYMLLSLAVLGASVLATSNHFISFFIGLELLSVSLFAMVGYMVRGKYKRISTLEASVKYMILSGVSSSFLLFGVALIYLDLGVLNFDSVYLQVEKGLFSAYGMLGVSMVVIGLAFKLSWVPFHMWTPDVYEGAPVPVTAFLATVSKAVVFAILLRFFVESGIYQLQSLVVVLTILATLSIIAGNGLALLQNNLKRLLAYSSIAHFGYLLVAFIAVSSLNSGEKGFAFEAIGVYLLAYVLTTWVAFGVLSVLSAPEKGEEAEQICSYKGLFWRRPWLSGLFTLSLLSLAGIPLTAGFIGKFYVFAAGVAENLWFLVFVVIVGSALGLYYYLKIVIEMCRSDENAEATIVLSHRTSVMNGSMLVILALAILALGIFPTPFVNIIQLATNPLL